MTEPADVLVDEIDRQGESSWPVGRLNPERHLAALARTDWARQRTAKGAQLEPYVRQFQIGCQLFGSSEAVGAVIDAGESRGQPARQIHR